MNITINPGATRPLHPDDIKGIHVRLTVDGARYVHVFLASDGGIARGGRGDRDFEGSVGDPELFSRVLERVTPDILRWAGQSWADPSPRGKTCELLIAFRDRHGRDAVTRWDYGTESPEPPEELRTFVLTLVEATNPWYRRQIELRRERAWRLLPAAAEVGA